MYKQSWYSKINNSNRLLHYCIFKHDFELEDYLKYISINKYRIALTKFRISSHNLAIEQGRHDNIPSEERKCLKCNMNVVENEFHFLLVCPIYYDIHVRRNIFKPYFCRWPTIHKFELMMSTKNRNLMNSVAKYLYQAFKRRNS